MGRRKEWVGEARVTSIYLPVWLGSAVDEMGYPNVGKAIYSLLKDEYLHRYPEGKYAPYFQLQEQGNGHTPKGEDVEKMVESQTEALEWFLTSLSEKEKTSLRLFVERGLPTPDTREAWRIWQERVEAFTEVWVLPSVFIRKFPGKFPVVNDGFASEGRV